MRKTNNQEPETKWQPHTSNNKNNIFSECFSLVWMESQNKKTASTTVKSEIVASCWVSSTETWSRYDCLTINKSSYQTHTHYAGSFCYSHHRPVFPSFTFSSALYFPSLPLQHSDFPPLTLLGNRDLDCRRLSSISLWSQVLVYICLEMCSLHSGPLYSLYSVYHKSQLESVLFLPGKQRIIGQSEGRRRWSTDRWRGGEIEVDGCI